MGRYTKKGEKKQKSGPFHVYSRLKAIVSPEDINWLTNYFDVLGKAANQYAEHYIPQIVSYNQRAKVKQARKNYSTNKQSFKSCKQLKPPVNSGTLTSFKNTKLGWANISAHLINVLMREKIRIVNLHKKCNNKSPIKKRICKECGTKYKLNKKEFKCKQCGCVEFTIKQREKFIRTNKPLMSFTDENQQVLKFNIENTTLYIGSAKGQNGRYIKFRYPDDDRFQHIKQEDISYVRLCRKKNGVGWEFYLQITLKGKPQCNLQSQQHGYIAIDVNLKSVDIIYDNGQYECKPYFDYDYMNTTIEECDKLQTKFQELDRQNNPECYNSDGTMIKGSHRTVRSNRMKTIQKRMNVLRNKISAWKIEHLNILARDIAAFGDVLIFETTDLVGWRLTDSQGQRKWLQNIPIYKFIIALKKYFKEENVYILNPKLTACSRKCSQCGYKNDHSTKGMIFKCDKCGYEENRQLNAAKNIQQYYLEYKAGIYKYEDIFVVPKKK